MAQLDLTQTDADMLIALPKVRTDETERDFPLMQQSAIIPLLSEDGRESFVLDIHAGRVNLSKITFQNRGKQVIVLVRLDVGGPPHRNPDGEEIPCPHLHVYREGFADKWAVAAPIDRFTDLSDQWKTLHDFMQFCSIVRPPIFRKGLLK